MGQLRYRHIKRGSTYRIISEEHRLNTFSPEGSIHVFLVGDKLVDVTMQFSGGTIEGDDRVGVYAGPITIYQCEETEEYWLRPTFEFHQEGRFEKL